MPNHYQILWIQLLPALKGPLWPHNLTFKKQKPPTLSPSSTPKKKSRSKNLSIHTAIVCQTAWNDLQSLSDCSVGVPGFRLPGTRYAAFVFRSGPPMSTRRTGDCLQCFWTSPSSEISKARRRNNDVKFHGNNHICLKNRTGSHGFKSLVQLLQNHQLQEWMGTSSRCKLLPFCTKKTQISPNQTNISWHLESRFTSQLNFCSITLINYGWAWNPQGWEMLHRFTTLRHCQTLGGLDLDTDFQKRDVMNGFSGSDFY